MNAIFSKILTALWGLGHAESTLSKESSAPNADMELLLVTVGTSAAIVTLFSSGGFTLRGLPGPRPVPFYNHRNETLSQLNRKLDTISYNITRTVT